MLCIFLLSMGKFTVLIRLQMKNIRARLFAKQSWFPKAAFINFLYTVTGLCQRGVVHAGLLVSSAAFSS